MLALTVGLAAAASPRGLLRIYGVNPDEVTGAGALGWRLFAARNIVVAGAALHGSRTARDVILAVQAPDQLVFLHAYRTRSVPRSTSLAAIATSGAIVAAGLVARHARVA